MLRYILAILALCLLPLSVANATDCTGGTPAHTCYWILGTGTMDLATDSAHWSLTTGGATCTCEPSSTDAIVFDASSGVAGATFTVTPNATVNVTNFTFGACTGTTTGCIIDFTTHNNNVNIVNAGGTSNFSGTGTGTRNLKMGTGTWTVGSNASASNLSVNFSNTSGLTFSGASAPLVLVGANSGSTNLYFGGKSWGPLTITGTATYPATTFQFENGTPSSDTFASLTINAPAFIVFRFSQTFTFTSGITVNGASWSAPVYLSSDSNNNNQQATLASGAVASFGYAVLHNITGATSTITVNPAVDLGSNGGTLSLTSPGTGGGGGFIIGGG